MDIKEISFEEIDYYWKNFLWFEYVNKIWKVDNHTQKNYSYKVMNYMSREQIDEFIKPTFIGYFINDQIVGVESGYKSNINHYRLRGLWVHEDYRKQSIATKMLNYLESRSNEKFIWTCPRESAVGFYKKYGFKISGLLETLPKHGNIYFAIKRNNRKGNDKKITSGFDHNM